MIKQIPQNTMSDILYRLQQYNAIFYKFVNMANVVFDDKVPTACVRASRNNTSYITLAINEDQWNNQWGEYQRTFVVAHECLHVLLQHLTRWPDTDNIDDDAMAKAVDIVVNHMLVEHFFFDREKFDPESKYIWIDTVFKDTKNIKHGRSVDYYYNEIISNKKNLKNDGGKSFDIHIKMGPNGMSPEDAKKFEEFMKKLMPELTEKDIEDLKKQLESDTIAGNSPNTELMSYTVRRTTKTSWTNVIKKYTKYAKNTLPKDHEEWTGYNRKDALLRKHNMMLPTIKDNHFKRNKERVGVFFYLDVSGSCAEYAERFLNAAASLPNKYFDSRTFTFDTSVKEIDPVKDKQFEIGGGTAFDIIEDNIIETMAKDDIPYPDLVFIITDGYGNAVAPQKPERWHWFMTPSSIIDYVDKKSNHYKLSDYV